MFGLIIKKEYLLDIINGKRKFDARLQDTNIRGRIGLIEPKTNILYGYAKLVNVRRITHEEYVKWHVSSTFSMYDAKKQLENTDNNKMLSAFAYDFIDVEPLTVPQEIEPKINNKVWIEFDDQYTNIGYVQQSLFDFE